MLMSNKIYICAAIILVVCLIGAAIYTFFEIYPIQKTVYPSREAENNRYLAAERWLKATGHKIRIINDFSLNNITEAPEKVIIIDNWVFDSEETKIIIERIKQGHFLVVCDDLLIQNPELLGLFDEQDIIIKEDSDRLILMEIQIADGAITAVDKPYFMQNKNLSDTHNARLTWGLTGARTDSSNTGILFIRHQNWNEPKSIFGAIMERGNFTPVVVSAFLLIFIGLWMIIPVFKKKKKKKKRNSRPIKDRFTAEIRFLKKYKALDYYLDINEHSNKDKENEYSYNELINQYRRRFNGNTEN
jgi:hypothetical protein